MFRSPYFYGVLALILYYVLSRIITNNWNPFALAKDKGNDDLSASLLQMIIFTTLTIFVYTTVFAARALASPDALVTQMPDIPENLLILMGVSAITAVGSRAIRSSQENNAVGATRTASAVLIPQSDRSTLTTDIDGKIDLVKIQMLIWTFIALVFYLYTFAQFMRKACYLSETAGCPEVLALPDIDSAFLALMGVSHGAYIIDKFASQPAAPTAGTAATIAMTADATTGTVPNGGAGKGQGNTVVPTEPLPITPATSSTPATLTSCSSKSDT